MALVLVEEAHLNLLQEYEAHQFRQVEDLWRLLVEVLCLLWVPLLRVLEDQHHQMHGEHQHHRVEDHLVEELQHYQVEDHLVEDHLVEDHPVEDHQVGEPLHHQLGELLHHQAGELLHHQVEDHLVVA